MRILFTGFTSRTVGSDRNVYDYMSNVFVLKRTLELAGHEVDMRPVSLDTDPCIEQDYDCAVVGIAACQGLSSRYKLGACLALYRFGKRAGIFPSDGRNIYIFPNSVKTCLVGKHMDGDQPLDSIDYFLGFLQRERNNIIGVEMGRRMKDVWTNVLSRLPHCAHGEPPSCDWKMLVSTHAWGNPDVYGRHFGTAAFGWDPTNIAIPMQFKPNELCMDGRFDFVHSTQEPLSADWKTERKRAWIVSSLQDQTSWVRRQKCRWPVITVGNKRKAREGQGADYMPERQMIDTYYRTHWGHLAFGYPLAEGGWWRMRYLHAAMAGMVTCCDPADARHMPPDYGHNREYLESLMNEQLAEVAANQQNQLTNAAWSADRAVAAVNDFVKGLA